MTTYWKCTFRISTIPIVFLISGKKKSIGYTDEFLSRHGMAKRSIIIITTSEFMTTEAWEYITHEDINGYEVLSFIKYRPLLWCIGILDGFGPHLLYLTTLR